MLLGISCHNWSIVLISVGAILACFAIERWARAEEKAAPAYRWGDAPRRPRKDDQGMIGHFIGLLGLAFALSYVVNNPPCG